MIIKVGSDGTDTGYIRNASCYHVFANTFCLNDKTCCTYAFLMRFVPWNICFCDSFVSCNKCLYYEICHAAYAFVMRFVSCNACLVMISLSCYIGFCGICHETYVYVMRFVSCNTRFVMTFVSCYIDFCGICHEIYVFVMRFVSCSICFCDVFRHFMR